MRFSNSNPNGKIYKKIERGNFKEPFLIVPVAVPSSGKSTIRSLLLKKYPDLCVVSRDDVRFKLLDYENTKKSFDPAIEPQVTEETDRIFQDCLNKNKNIYIDATNVKKMFRESFVERSKDKGYETVAIRIHIDPLLAIARQKYRERKVPDAVIYKMHYDLEEPTESEFDKVISIFHHPSKEDCKNMKGSWKKSVCRVCRDVR